ncbi:MAG: hypothetical protein C4547_00840 [Phycisphaerales bacterium]|nr:MAG: hypothetical protein C4547_00840 [Phycisphaerales bacterium]
MVGGRWSVVGGRWFASFPPFVHPVASERQGLVQRPATSNDRQNTRSRARCQEGIMGRREKNQRLRAAVAACDPDLRCRPWRRPLARQGRPSRTVALAPRHRRRPHTSDKRE